MVFITLKLLCRTPKYQGVRTALSGLQRRESAGAKPAADALGPTGGADWTTPEAGRGG